MGRDAGHIALNSGVAAGAEEILIPEENLGLKRLIKSLKRSRNTGKIELFSTASEEVMVSLLPVLDDFDRASVEIEKDKENETLKGILLIKNKLFDSLKSKGLSLVEVSKGDDFNADDHEAVTQIPAPSKNMQGKIIDIIEKGYKLGDKVIRYPKVVIGK
jgi:molecular chaperone GrpE